MPRWTSSRPTTGSTRASAEKPGCSGALLTAFPLRELFPRQQGGQSRFLHNFSANDYLGDVVAARDVVHDVEQHLLEDGPQSAGTSAAQQGEIGDRLDGVGSEFEVDTVELEELTELFDECVSRLYQYPDQCISIERADRGDHRQPTDEFRNQTEFDQVLRPHVAERII